jgi:hypothetical protein
MGSDHNVLIREKIETIMTLAAEANELRQLIAQLEARIAEERRYSFPHCSHECRVDRLEPAQ